MKGLAEQELTLPRLENLIGSTVVDPNGGKIGTLHCLWEDESLQPCFLGMKTGWLGLGAIHVVPAEFSEFGPNSGRVRLPFNKDIVKDAPSYKEEDEMTPERQQEIFDYYNTHGDYTKAGKMEFGRRSGMEGCEQGLKEPGKAPSQEEARIPLHEEQLKVGKREVEIGGVRLRKIVRTETVQQPVELKREELVVERETPSGEMPAGEHAFEAEEIYIPLRAQEAVVEKEPRIKEEIRARKESRTEQTGISETVRKEELKTEKE